MDGVLFYFLCVAGSCTIREQEAIGVCFLCAKRGHNSVNCPRLKEGGAWNKKEDKGNWYESTANVRNIPTHYKNRRRPILDPGAAMNLQTRTGTWHCKPTKKALKKRNKKHVQMGNINWHGNSRDDKETVNQAFGTNKENIQQKSLEAMSLFSQTESALDEICT
jgi:hypothetical protein